MTLNSTSLILRVLFFSLFSMLFSCARKESSAITNFMSTQYMSEPAYDTATFGTGCFWCTEALFQQLDGVVKVTSGYSGGDVTNPTYEQICTKTTGHAECLNILYDKSKISFDELLEVFWQSHDPTTLNKQGNDVGPQYRSVIFYHDEEKREKAEKYKEALNQSGAWANPVVTEISPIRAFYPAEAYHQDYYKKNGGQPYCYYVIKPKLDKFQKVFKNKLKKD